MLHQGPQHRLELQVRACQLSGSATCPVQWFAQLGKGDIGHKAESCTSALFRASAPRRLMMWVMTAMSALCRRDTAPVSLSSGSVSGAAALHT